MKLFIGGLVCAVLPYGLFLGITREVVENGVVVDYERVNFSDYASGIAALAIAWTMVALWETETDTLTRAPVRRSRRRLGR